ncbi:C2H2-type zinc finger transcription factor [Rhizophagus clarus]|uniref:C2H2-type zinc finger transcription factor n=1 Tax=Rhizophagus clarus TaxID=94130 RepID=A0A8H3LJG1_9GLOM|nr:C2H2-type zinc finger transcription factor [Rhizophagus clarus]
MHLQNTLAKTAKRSCRSYRGFLDQHRDNIITSPLSFSNWKKLNDFWSLKFLKEAENLGLDLKDKTKSERSEKWVKLYWEEIIREHEKFVNTPSPYSSKVHNLRTRQNIDYNENRMAKKNIKGKGQLIRSSQPKEFIQSLKQSNLSVNEDNEIENEQEIDEDLTDFDLVYYSLDPAKMWTLKSTGRIVEKVIYEYARNLPYESCLHSFIINDVDKEAEFLFRKEEWEEMFSSNLQNIPKIDRSLTDLMKKYSVTDLSSFRNMIFESFLPDGTSYSNKEHFDLNYIRLVYSIMHTLWENENFTLDSSRLEGWYQHNIWSPIIDRAFHDSKINLIRGEGMSTASSDRKNDASCDADRKKIGKKGDGIFRLKGDRLEIGAIEAGRKWEGTNGRKYLKDSLKLSKMLRDMIVQLTKECNGNERIVRKLQTIGMLHSANRFQLLIMDIPNGYICRIKRFDIQEVAGQINNPPLAFVIKDILRAKAIMTQTLELVQEKKSNLDDLDDFDDNGKEVNRSVQCTTHNTINLSETYKTPLRNYLGQN